MFAARAVVFGLGRLQVTVETLIAAGVAWAFGVGWLAGQYLPDVQSGYRPCRPREAELLDLLRSSGRRGPASPGIRLELVSRPRWAWYPLRVAAPAGEFFLEEERDRRGC
jgi:hypothetical protein